MRLIAHRRNTVAQLLATPTDYGVEADIRSEGGHLVLHHDPLSGGESFDEWIAAYHHGTLILNVKEEGLESLLMERMRARGLEDYFFLDQSFPFLLKTTGNGERRSAVRVSEFEPVEIALSLADRLDWVWVDCFSRFPLDEASWIRLRDAGLRLCLVSPELLGRDPGPEIAAIREQLDDWGVEPDAVCCKLEAASFWNGPVR